VQETLEKALSKVADSPFRCSAPGAPMPGACLRAGGAFRYAGRAFDESLGDGRQYQSAPRRQCQLGRVMPAHFHARFKAIARRYRYVIYNDQIRPAHLNEEITWNHRPLDVERMAEAAQYLVGTHDFSAFRAGQCQAKSPIKKMHHLRVTRHGKMIVLDIRANAFLHHMVRNIAGVLMTIGAGERPVEWMKEVLESRSAAPAG
jgi:tRNA pseudouridine38-40 synthase